MQFMLKNPAHLPYFTLAQQQRKLLPLNAILVFLFLLAHCAHEKDKCETGPIGGPFSFLYCLLLSTIMSIERHWESDAVVV